MILSRASFKQTKFTASQVQVAKTPLASFESNVSGLYIPEILAYFSASQAGSGDPSPSNIKPISGVSSVDTTVCGKNLFNGTNVINAYFSSNGTITASGATRLAYARCKANTAYTVSKTAGARFGIAYSSELPAVSLQCSGYTVDNTASSITITTGADAKYICAYVYHSSYDSGTAEDMLSSIQIEESNIATPYEAYIGTTATTALGGTYYGGYLNVPTGLMTVTHGYVDLSSLSYTTTSWGAKRATIADIRTRSASVLPDAMASDYVLTTYSDLNTNKPNNHCAVGSGASTYVYIVTDGTISGYFAYELATPQTVQLTPAQLEQLLGQNNVFCSADDVAVKYWHLN